MKFIGVGEAARQLGCLESQLRRALRNNPDLIAAHRGRDRLIAPDDLPRIRQALETAGAFKANTSVTQKVGAA
jgi:hypothetical protein